MSTASVAFRFLLIGVENGMYLEFILLGDMRNMLKRAIVSELPHLFLEIAGPVKIMALTSRS